MFDKICLGNDIKATIVVVEDQIVEPSSNEAELNTVEVCFQKREMYLDQNLFDEKLYNDWVIDTWIHKE